MNYKHVRLDFHEKHAVVTIDRPPENLLGLEAMEEVSAALTAVRERPGIEVLVLRGAGGVLGDFDLEQVTKSRVRRLIQVYHRIFETVRMMDAVSIAAVEKRATGAGFELALVCNLIVAGEGSTFQLPALNYGLIPTIASAMLPRLAPRRRAMEWILTGCEIPVAQLEHDGIVNRVVPLKSFDRKLDAFIGEITGKSGAVLRLAKKAQFASYGASYEDALARAHAIFLGDLMDLHDSEEGLRAHREGRAPQWKNR
ncbi:MAG: enoyl-CoA hydratase/isomerase family protein [Gemmatimonadetes bacterium]|nr:enoyl-CoA hydratase/isomerase family protein [Gemmatimonadota bacterium]